MLRQAQQEDNSNSGTSVAFLEQLRRRHGGRLNVIWDDAPAHRGEVLGEYLSTPGLNLRLVILLGYSPDSRRRKHTPRICPDCRWDSLIPLDSRMGLQLDAQNQQAATKSDA